MEQSQARKWVLVAACWTTLVVLFTAHAYLYATVSGQQIDLVPVLAWAMSEWYTWAALTPFVVRAARKHPIGAKAPARAIVMNIGLAVVFSLLHVFVQSGLRYLGFWGSPTTRTFGGIVTQALPVKFHINFATCAFILCCAHAVEYYYGYRDRKVRTSQLETALAQARLEALRMQINPHFLFNTLNSISALIDDEPKAAHQMLARLGDFLRLTLKSKGDASSSLEEELEFLKSYLQIEQVRFGDRLRVRIDVEPAALKAMVPSLILQPIVENAFRHAISKVETGSLDIGGYRRGDRLELSVRDNGPGVSPNGGKPGEGLGVANTRARLQAQYGNAQSLFFENAPGGGLVVKITIPFVQAAAK